MRLERIDEALERVLIVDRANGDQVTLDRELIRRQVEPLIESRAREVSPLERLLAQEERRRIGR